MACLLDTSILARLANTADAQHAPAVESVADLLDSGELLHITPQTLIEFRSVATRPTANNGLGLACAVAESLAQEFEDLFVMLPDSPSIFAAWKLLVEAHGIVGKQVHDARLFAVCQAHGVGSLLTFNSAHFARFVGATPAVAVLTPQRFKSSDA